jgi:hypothetical protein
MGQEHDSHERENAAPADSSGSLSSRGRRWLREHRGPLLVLALLVGVFFWRLVLLGQVLVPADLLGVHFPWQAYNPPGFRVTNLYASDVIDSQVPARAVAVDLLRSGQLPLWDPYTSAGRPLGTMPVYALSFPLNFLLVLLPLDLGFSYLAAARLLIAAFGMFAFLRQLRVQNVAATVGAVAFAFNGFLVVWLNATAGVTLSVAPWVLWAGERLVRRPSAGRVLLLGLAVAALISGGFLQVAIYVLYSLAAYLLFRVAVEAWPTRCWRRALGKLALGGLAILAGIALMAPQLLSFYDQLQLTSYDEGRAGLESGMGHEQLYGLVRYLIPDYYGRPATTGSFEVYPEHAGYVGVLPLFLTALAVGFAGRRHKTVWFFAFLGLVAIGMVYGAPFNRLLVRLPALNLSSSLRLRAVVALCVAVLAAFGLDSLAREGSRGAPPRVIGVLALVLALQAAVIVGTEHYWGPGGAGAGAFADSLWPLLESGQTDHVQVEQFLRYLLWALSGLALLIAGAKGLISRRAVGLAALLLLVFDLLSWGMTYYRPVDREGVFPQTPGIAFLQSAPGVFRVTGLDDALPPNTPGVYRLQDIAGHDPLAPDRYREFLVRVDPDARFGVRGTIMRLSSASADLSSPLLDLANVQYVVAPPLREGERHEERPLVQDGAFVPVYSGPDLAIYENTDVLPRCYTVRRAEVVPDPEAILERLASGEVDPREVVLLEEEPPALLSGQPGVEGGGRAEIVTYAANRVVVEVETEEPVLLVLSDVHYPGWEARVDGRPTHVYRANYLFRAVFVPRGSHAVEYLFRPRPFVVGQAVRVVVGAALVGALVWERRRRGRGRGREEVRS